MPGPGIDLLLVRRAVAIFLPVAALATLCCGLAYAVVQNDMRSGANDPQFQLAEDAASRLNAGAQPAAVLGADGPIDAARSLAPFLAVYDTSHAMLATNGSLDGAPPLPPPGVLDAARRDGLDVVTWQPQPGVRIAAVVLPWRGGTVLAGRSLRKVEERETQTSLIAAIAWIGMLGVLAATCLVAARLWPEPRAAAT